MTEVEVGIREGEPIPLDGEQLDGTGHGPAVTGRYRVVLSPLLTLAVLFVAWELAVRIFEIPQFLLPKPTTIMAYVVRRWDVPWHHTAATGLATGVGFLLAVVLGVLLAISMVWSRAFEEAVYPLVIMTQVIPKVAVAPLLVVYLGFGRAPKIFLAFLVAFFPMIVNTALGLRSVSTDLIHLLSSLRATKVQVFSKVRIPNAVPYMVEGAKISIALAVIGTIVSEFIAGRSGLGYLISTASANIDTVQGFAALFVLVVMGVTLFETVALLGNLVVRTWAGREPES